MNNKTIKIILIILIALFLSAIAYLLIFPPLPKIPNLHTIESVKKIEKDKTTIEWIHIVGIMDQNYPDFIIIQKENVKDTVCFSRNIADIELNDNNLIIGFYGTPTRGDGPITIPNEVFGYKIDIDTTFVRNGGNQHKTN